MKYLVLFCIFIVSFQVSFVLAQSERALSIGDTLQEVQVKVWYDGKEELRTLKKNGKPIIMDFGTTTCPPCIEAYNHLNDIYPELKDRMEAYFVTRQSISAVKKFFGRNDLYEKLNVPIIYEDTVLHNIFEHASQPHIAWLDAKLILRNLTHHTELTNDNVLKFSTGKSVVLKVKNDFPYDYSKPFTVISRDQLRLESVPKVVRSILVSGEAVGVLPRIESFPHEAEEMTRFLAMNMDVVAFFTKLFSFSRDNLKVEYSKVIVVDEQRRSIPLGEKIAWLFDEKFCFEAKSEEGALWTYLSLMESFSDAVGVRVTIEDVDRVCWVIRKVEKSDSKLTNNFIRSDYWSVVNIMNHFNRTYQGKYIINLLGDEDNNFKYDKVFPVDKSDLSFEGLKAVLEEKGYTMTEECMPIECLVIQVK